MLSELCAVCRNYFDKDEYHRYLPRREGRFTITNGTLPDLEGFIIKGQCFRIYGSAVNDGVYEYTDDLALKDETFTGLIQSMHVEPDFLALAHEIEAWEEKYGSIDGTALSPFNSESFGGYSYSKSAGNGENGGVSAADPVSMFRQRLKRWRKI